MSRHSFRSSTNKCSTPRFAYEDLEPRQLMATAGLSWQMYNAANLVALAMATNSAKPLPASISIDKTTLYFNDVQSSADAGAASPAQTIRITNTGGSALTLPSDAFTITGPNAAEFSVVSPSVPATIQPGKTLDVSINFNAAALDIRTATLTIKSSDTSHPTLTVNLRGLGTAGTGGGAQEPSLQRILDLYQIPLNVGDDDPSTTDFPVPPLPGNDEVELQRMIKAATGNVSIQLLGVFDNNKSPATSMGWYRPGTPDDNKPLFSVPTGADSQSVNPTVSGSTAFDPGTSSFSLYTIFPAFTNRASYSEDALNTWESNVANRRKIRFYPLKNSDGSVVPNAYVFAAEDWNVAYDFNDVVGIIRNVAAAPNVTTGPEIGLSNADGQPFWDRLVFNRIEHPDTTWANVVHDKSVVTIRNTGNDPLNISSMTLTGTDAGAFQIVSPTGAFSIAPGATQNVTVKFVGTASSGLVKTFTANLIINSDDADEAATTVQLRGLWQAYSEHSPTDQYSEPSLGQLFALFGYSTKALNANQTLDTNGAVSKAGDETLSGYWFRADSNAPITVRMLAAFHRQFNVDDTTGNPVSAASTIKWYFQGASSTTSTLFTHYIYEGQSLLPHISGSTTNYAQASFTPSDPSKPFGFKVDNVFSDDALNKNVDGTFGAHAFRFFAAKDRSGRIIPNTWIIAQDYTGLSYSNYDYQDNIYIVSNVKPMTAPAAPTGVAVAGAGQGMQVTWTANTEGNVVGYDIFRSDSADGTYTKLNDAPVAGTAFIDGSAMVGQTFYYKIAAVDENGLSSAATVTHGTRGADASAPVAPNIVSATGSINGVTVKWDANTELDLAGYDVYRSTDSTGGFVKINTAGQVAGTSFFDANAVGARTNYYRIVAVDTSGNASPQSMTRVAFRPMVGTSGSYNAVRYSSDGTLNFVYYDGTDHRLKFATRSASGMWSNTQIVDNASTGPGAYVSMAIDAHDNVGVAYYDAVLGDLKYATLNRATNTWTIATVDSSKTTGLYSSLTFDQNGLANIAYYRKTSGDLRVAHFNGTAWRLETIDSSGDVGKNATIALNSRTGLLGITYNGQGANLKYAGENANGTWSKSTIDATTGAGYVSMAFDTAGRPSASYFSSPTGDLRFALLNKGKWTVKTLSSKGTVGQYTQLDYGLTDGRARVIYYDRTRNQVMQAVGSMSGWTFTTVQTGGGKRIAAAPGPSAGHVTFSWADATANMLRLTDV